MDNSLGSIIDSASSVLILLPTRPGLDHVASGLSFQLSLKGRKEAQVTCSSPMLVEFNRLVGVEKISSDLGNKNLVIRFLDYRASDIERVSWDIENGQFKLTVIPQPGFTAPRREQAQFGYSGVSADTIILIGGQTEADFPELKREELTGAKIVHIGTMAFSSSFSVMSFARPASTISEIIALLIKENAFLLDPDIATNLVLGIEEGSGHFTKSDVTADTFSIFAELLRAGGRRIAKEKPAVPAVVSPAGFPFRPQPAGGQAFQEVESKEQPPQDWLNPKVYKGTSVS